MPEWCPRCNALLPEGFDKCPRCGKSLTKRSSDNYSPKDILNISAYILMIVLIPVILVIVIGIVCVAFGN